MTVILIVALILCMSLCWQLVPVEAGMRRAAVVLGAALWGGLLLCATELLSIFHGLSFWPLVIWWLLVCIGLVLLIKHYGCKKEAWPFWQVSFDRVEMGLSGGVMGIAAASLLVAVIAPPNTWDSMTTHMARVMHWIQDGTVANYPTSMLKQLNYPAFGSYCILHLQILSGGDRWAPVVQWGAMVLSLAGVSLIAQLLGAGRLGQVMAAVMAATIPMGILQSNSTQNDYLAALTLIMFVVSCLLFIRSDRRLFLFAAGIALGLAFFVKGTTYIYGLVLLGWLVVMIARKKGALKGLLLGSGILLLAVVLNLFYYTRNVALTQTLVPPTESAHVLSWGDLGGRTLGNMVRSVGMHFSTPWEAANRLVSSGVNGILDGMGEGSDERALMGAVAPFDLHSPLNEDVAGNAAHLLLYLIAGVLAWRYARRISAVAKEYAWAVIAGFILFVVMVKWSPFSCRYHLPVFVLLAPWAALVFENSVGRKTAVVASGLLLVVALPWVFGNSVRPLVGPKNIFHVSREEQYFRHWESVYPVYVALGHQMTEYQCKDVGLVLKGDSWEYPMWPFIKKAGSNNLRIEHIKVDNASAAVPYPRGKFDPCALVYDSVKEEGIQVVNGAPFIRTMKSTISIFTRFDYMPPGFQAEALKQWKGN